MPRDRDDTGLLSRGDSLRRVVEVGVLAHQTLQRASSGVIVAAFERSFYAVFDACWICVGSLDIGSGPLHVLCEEWPVATFAVGQDVAAVNGVIHVDGVSLARFADAPVWTPEPAPAWTLAQLRAGVRFAGSLWSTTADEGLAALGRMQSPQSSSALIAAAVPGVRVVEQIAAGDGAGLTSADRTALAGLVGLGPGLTPSGDDILIGALLALAALGRRDARDVLWGMCSGVLDRTGDISRAHLEAAARGYGAAVLHDAIHILMRGDTEKIEPALAAVAAVGHTSGRDGMAGALIALRATINSAAFQK
jgi:hypothetical protein